MKKLDIFLVAWCLLLLFIALFALWGLPSPPNQSLIIIYYPVNTEGPISSSAIALPQVSRVIARSAAEWRECEVTAYCSCSSCCGKCDGITASGVKAVEGVTIAADWSKYPKGTVLEIEGIGKRVVQDRGGAIKNNRIDLYFDSHTDALNFGRQQLRVRELS